MKTIAIAPKQEPKEYQVEVYVAFNGYKPFVVASIVGDEFAYVPKAEIVRRYVFTVFDPTLELNEKTLKEEL